MQKQILFYIQILYNILIFITLKTYSRDALSKGNNNDFLLLQVPKTFQPTFEVSRTYCLMTSFYDAFQ